VAFSGTDVLTIEVCDFDKACTERIFTVDVDGNIVIFNGFSPNKDGINDTWLIGNIESLQATKSNHVSIFDRWGDVVFEVSNYNNADAIFAGLNKSGGELQSGIYFYRIEYASGRRPDTGYVSLKR
jgi:gliding motility-associated-like protein